MPRPAPPGAAVPLGCADSPSAGSPAPGGRSAAGPPGRAAAAPAHDPGRSRRGDQPPVPAHQGVGPDEEAGPARPRQDTADGGEQGPVGRFELWSGSLAAEHGELMTQDKDLKVLGGIAAGELGEELDGAAQRQVRESWQHRGGLRGGGSGGATVASRGRSEPPAHGPCLNICTLRRRRYLGAWGGGPGYGFILAEFLPRLRVAGLDEADAQALVVVNPAGFLTWRAG